MSQFNILPSPVEVPPVMTGDLKLLKKIEEQLGILLGQPILVRNPKKAKGALTHYDALETAGIDSAGFSEHLNNLYSLFTEIDNFCAEADDANYSWQQRTGKGEQASKLPQAIYPNLVSPYTARRVLIELVSIRQALLGQGAYGPTYVEHEELSNETTPAGKLIVIIENSIRSIEKASGLQIFDREEYQENAGPEYWAVKYILEPNTQETWRHTLSSDERFHIRRAISAAKKFANAVSNGAVAIVTEQDQLIVNAVASILSGRFIDGRGNAKRLDPYTVLSAASTIAAYPLKDSKLMASINVRELIVSLGTLLSTEERNTYWKTTHLPHPPYLNYTDYIHFKAVLTKAKAFNEYAAEIVQGYVAPKAFADKIEISRSSVEYIVREHWDDFFSEIPSADIAKLPNKPTAYRTYMEMWQKVVEVPPSQQREKDIRIILNFLDKEWFGLHGTPLHTLLDGTRLEEALIAFHNTTLDPMTGKENIYRQNELVRLLGANSQPPYCTLSQSHPHFSEASLKDGAVNDMQVQLGIIASGGSLSR